MSPAASMKSQSGSRRRRSSRPRSRRKVRNYRPAIPRSRPPAARRGPIAFVGAANSEMSTHEQTVNSSIGEIAALGPGRCPYCRRSCRIPHRAEFGPDRRQDHRCDCQTEPICWRSMRPSRPAMPVPRAKGFCRRCRRGQGAGQARRAMPQPRSVRPSKRWNKRQRGVLDQTGSAVKRAQNWWNRGTAFDRFRSWADMRHIMGRRWDARFPRSPIRSRTMNNAFARGPPMRSAAMADEVTRTSASLKHGARERTQRPGQYRREA